MITVGVLHPGEMGASVAAAAMVAGHTVRWTNEGRSPATIERARVAGLPAPVSLAAIIADCDVILSVCPPHAARELAMSVLAAGFQGIWVDANAVSPDTVRDLAAQVAKHGAEFVDGGIEIAHPEEQVVESFALFVEKVLLDGRALAVLDQLELDRPLLRQGEPELARKHDCLTIVDTVTSLGGIPVRMDEWGIDAVYSGTQKCLSCVPGLSPLSFSDRALERVRNRKSPVQSWFMDLSLVAEYWGGNGKRAYHHTAPVNALYALHEALAILKKEGLEHAWARHERNHQALRAGLEAMGLTFVVKPEERLPQLNAVSVPRGVDEAAVRRKLLDDYSLEIGAGLEAMAGKIWRVGLMGYASNPRNVLFFLGGLDAVLSEMAAPIQSGRAVAAAREQYGK